MLAKAAGLLVAIALMAAAAAAGAWLVLNWSSDSVEVTVPDFAGLTEAEAIERAEGARLSAEVAEERSDRQVPSGKIIGQEPAAGSHTRPGRTVRLVRSLGEDQVSVPDLTGRPAREARLEIQQLGLRVGTISSTRWSEPDDRVLSQRPAPGERRSRGDPVDLLVSRGRRLRVWLMPDLTGRSGEEAQQLLEGANLRVTRRTETRGGVSPGTVLRQTPPAGSPVTERQAVSLTVAE